MSIRAVVVAHREALAAEGIAAALSRYPGLAPIGFATSASEAIGYGQRADAVALDGGLPDVNRAVARLRRMGVRVIVMGDEVLRPGEADELNLPRRSSIASLAASLAPGARPPGPRRPRLTRRQREVLALVAKGMTGRQIARSLGITPKTVEHHKTSIFGKLGVTNQAAAAALAAAQGTDGWTGSI
jgi:DNA-binding NarL/FixJ family response regulator